MRYLLVRALALLAAVRVLVAWSHDWSTPSAFQFADFGYSLLSPAQIAFVANAYAIVSLEKCTGRAQGVPTEDAIYTTAAH